MSPSLPLDAGLLARFREAAQQIVWSPGPRGPRRPRGSTWKRARLHDEEARVELREGPSGTTVVVDSGPVGALVVLLEADRRGLPTSIGAGNAGGDTAFPQGSIVAVWGTAEVPRDGAPTFHDLVELARYALA